MNITRTIEMASALFLLSVCLAGTAKAEEAKFPTASSSPTSPLHMAIGVEQPDPLAVTIREFLLEPSVR